MSFFVIAQFSCHFHTFKAIWARNTKIATFLREGNPAQSPKIAISAPTINCKAKVNTTFYAFFSALCSGVLRIFRSFLVGKIFGIIVRALGYFFQLRHYAFFYHNSGIFGILEHLRRFGLGTQKSRIFLGQEIRSKTRKSPLAPGLFTAEQK